MSSVSLYCDNPTNGFLVYRTRTGTFALHRSVLFFRSNGQPQENRPHELFSLYFVDSVDNLISSSRACSGWTPGMPSAGPELTHSGWRDTCNVHLIIIIIICLIVVKKDSQNVFQTGIPIFE